MRRVRLFASLILLLALSPIAHADSVPSADNTFRKGWTLLSEEQFAEARETFGGITPGEYDLGDYVLYFTGVALSREGKPVEAAEILERLLSTFPESPLVPYLRHELAFAAAKEGDIPSARKYFRDSRGKVTGNGRKAAEGYIAARLMEDKGEEKGEEQKEEQGEEQGEEQ
ncbi:MAG: tetratricopeptide repeat protein, partial [Candidatus Deferrimicrobiaceae bacterium]